MGPPHLSLHQSVPDPVTDDCVTAVPVKQGNGGMGAGGGGGGERGGLWG